MSTITLNKIQEKSPIIDQNKEPVTGPGKIDDFGAGASRNEEAYPIRVDDKTGMWCSHRILPQKGDFNGPRSFATGSKEDLFNAIPSIVHAIITKSAISVKNDDEKKLIDFVFDFEEPSATAPALIKRIRLYVLKEFGEDAPFERLQLIETRHLPSAIWEKIFEYCADKKTLSRISRTCNAFHFISSNKKFWPLDPEKVVHLSKQPAEYSAGLTGKQLFKKIERDLRDLQERIELLQSFSTINLTREKNKDLFKGEVVDLYKDYNGILN